MCLDECATVLLDLNFSVECFATSLHLALGLDWVRKMFLIATVLRVAESSKEEFFNRVCFATVLSSCTSKSFELLHTY